MAPGPQARRKLRLQGRMLIKDPGAGLPVVNSRIPDDLKSVLGVFDPGGANVPSRLVLLHPQVRKPLLRRSSPQ
ncbi:hypothetical protein LZ32DRAFT_600888 [Colletotrichum eremochloae]|nr:hypothetical protein LZ32DRAFT_600888 [Colletotrichum eremochloae]